MSALCPCGLSRQQGTGMARPGASACFTRLRQGLSSSAVNSCCGSRSPWGRRLQGAQGTTEEAGSGGG